MEENALGDLKIKGGVWERKSGLGRKRNEKEGNEEGKLGEGKLQQRSGRKFQWESWQERGVLSSLPGPV